MHVDHQPSKPTMPAPRFAIGENVARTMSSAELLEIINSARAEAGEPEIRRNKFAEKIEDELEGEHYTKRVVQNLNKTESVIFDLTRDQCMLVSMRESKAVRRNVVARLNAIEATAASMPLQNKLAGEMAILECFTRLLLARQLQALRLQLQALEHRPRALLVQRLQRDALHLRGLARSLHAISPLATVARGYSILTREGDGTLVHSTTQISVGERLQARLADGTLVLAVEAAQANQ